MRSLASLILAFSILLSTCYAHDEQHDLGLVCAKKLIKSDSFVRADHEHHRIFVVMKTIKRTELRSLILRLESCFEDHEWNAQWSLSVFSSKKIAGYKDEKHIIQFHKANEWAKGYLAEYNSLTRILTLAPAVSPKEEVLPKSP